MAADFTGAYNRLAAVLAVKLYKNLPILAHTRQQASDKVFQNIGANGETMLYALPDYGKPGKGGSLDPTQLAYKAGSVPLTLHQYNIPFTAGDVNDGDISGSVREANEILDKKLMVEAPLAAHLASDIQKRAANIAMAGAGGAVVASANDIWTGLSLAASIIQETYAAGELFGVMGPLMRGMAAHGAANQFNPVSDISKMWRDSAIERYARTDWYETPDVDMFEMGDVELGDGTWAMAADYDPAVGTLSIDSTDNTAAGTIKAGTVFSVAGVTQCDVFGADTSVPFAFVVQEDATVASGAATLKVQPIYIKTDSGALCNVNAYPVDDAAITCDLEAGKKYLRALVWDKAGIGTGFGRKAPIQGAKNFKFESGERGLWFYGAYMGDIWNSANIWRLDVLTGSVVTRSNWVCTVFVPID